MEGNPVKRSAREKVSGAARTTDSAQAKLRLAIALLESPAVNSVGVYLHPGEVKYALLEVTETLQRVRQALVDTEWPTDDDYNAAGY